MAGAVGRGEGGEIGAGAVAVGWDECAMCAMMSSLRMRPFSPVPCIWWRSIWCSCAMRRASGETRSSVAVALVALGAADVALVPLLTLALAPGTLADGTPPLPAALGA